MFTVVFWRPVSNKAMKTFFATYRYKQRFIDFCDYALREFMADIEADNQ